MENSQAADCVSSLLGARPRIWQAQKPSEDSAQGNVTAASRVGFLEQESPDGVEEKRFVPEIHFTALSQRPPLCLQGR